MQAGNTALCLKNISKINFYLHQTFMDWHRSIHPLWYVDMLQNWQDTKQNKSFFRIIGSCGKLSVLTNINLNFDFYFTFQVNLCSHQFCDFQNKGPRPKWTIYNYVSDNPRKCLSVGNFEILSVICNAWPSFWFSRLCFGQDGNTTLCLKRYHKNERHLRLPTHILNKLS